MTQQFLADAKGRLLHRIRHVVQGLWCPYAAELTLARVSGMGHCGAGDAPRAEKPSPLRLDRISAAVACSIFAMEALNT